MARPSPERDMPPRSPVPILRPASVTSQMTAATFSSFQQTDVSVSIAAQVAMVQVSLAAWHVLPPGWGVQVAP
jgi:hypothetical protein